MMIAAHRNEVLSSTPADLAVSDHDRAAGMLLALAALLGAVVGALAVVWLGMRWLAADAKSVPVRMVQVNGPAGDALENLGLDALSPQEMARESDATEPAFSETLRTVIDVAALCEVDIDETALLDDSSHSAEGEKTPGDKGKGSGGDGDGKPGVPPHLRWEIEFAKGTLDDYGRQLDAFELELGALGVPERGKVTYAKNFSKSPPDTYVGAAKDDKRLYMTWKKGKRRDADRALMNKAGVTGDGLILMFWPDEAEQQLLRLEHDFQGRDASTIRKTRFGIRRKESGKDYEFYVVEQTPI